MNLPKTLTVSFRDFVAFALGAVVALTVAAFLALVVILGVAWPW